jgi:hypothetical protein
MIKQREAELRAAINAGNYSAADELLIALRHQVEDSWPVAGAEERQQIAARVLSLLRWARQTVLSKRAHTQQRLGQITRNMAYSSTGARGRDQLELEA